MAQVLFRRYKEAGTPLTAEKRTELLAVLGGDEALLTELLSKAEQRVAAAAAQADGVALKDDGEGDMEAQAQLQAVGDEAVVVAEEEVPAEGDDRLLTEAEADLIADKVADRVMARIDEIMTRLSDLDTELKSRGLARVKDDAADDEPDLVAQDILKRLKAAEETLAHLTEDDLPTSVLQVLNRREPAGIELKDDSEVDAIIGGRMAGGSVGSVADYLFGPK